MPSWGRFIPTKARKYVKIKHREEVLVDLKKQKKRGGGVRFLRAWERGLWQEGDVASGGEDSFVASTGDLPQIGGEKKRVTKAKPRARA